MSSNGRPELKEPSFAEVAWMEQEIERARSRERLDYLAGMFRIATQDGNPWTKDKKLMAEFKRRWKQRLREVLEQTDNPTRHRIMK